MNEAVIANEPLEAFSERGAQPEPVVEDVDRAGPDRFGRMQSKGGIPAA